MSKKNKTKQNKIKLNSSKTSSTFKKETTFLWFLLVLARADMFLSNKQHSQNPAYRTLSGCFKIFWTKSSTSETPRVVLGKRKQINKINKKKRKNIPNFGGKKCLWSQYRELMFLLCITDFLKVGRCYIFTKSHFNMTGVILVQRYGMLLGAKKVKCPYQRVLEGPTFISHVY